MLNKIFFLFILVFPLHSIAEISKEAKYASYNLQVNLAKYKAKSEVCHRKMKSFILTHNDMVKMKSLPREAGMGLGKLLDDAITKCSQPEVFNLANSLLLLQEQNLVDKSNDIQEQIFIIRKLVFSKNSILAKIEYEKLSSKLKLDLDAIDFLKQPFDLFQVIENSWGEPN